MKRPKFWDNGIRFECQGSGNCCVSRGGYGYVYLTLDDRRALAQNLGIGTAAFTRKYCEQDGGIWKLKDAPTEECVFLKDKRCSVYTARPTQCRTWPFWPETLNAKTWSGEVASFCPGVGRGKTWTPEEVETQLNIQRASQDKYGT
jgi:Fe-S-cluster containining protein